MASAVSTPPSDSRHSTSSQPSQTSSATLHSAHDPAHHEHGESSSGKRRRLLHRTDGGSQAAQSNPDGHTRSQGLLGADLATEREREKRRSLPRKSRGFLLDAALPGSSARRRSRETRAEDKGKRSDSRHKSRSPSSYGGSRRAFSRGSSAHSRPLTGDTDVPTSENGHAPEEYEAGTPESRHERAQALRDFGIDVDAAEHGEAAGTLANASIDPAQIIHMALNLSESRRRNLGHGQLVAPSIGTRSRRNTTTSMGMPNTPMQGSFHDYGFGGSLKAHLQQQRRISRNMSPNVGRLSTPASRHVSMSSPNALLDHNLGPQHDYTFTAATLARAEKAKTYVELGAEYRRLLQFLQPLRADSEFSISYTYSAFSTPGSPTAELKRFPSRTGPEPLGRAYNPLQFIRNRKLRGRERRKLDPDVNDFEDVDRVKMWVDDVEEATEQQKYRQEHKVTLPEFTPNPMLRNSQEQSSGDAKRPSILLGKQKRPRMDWFTLPSEWLADAVWLEQDSHKGLIEDRNGNRIFPPPRSTSTANPRMSRDQARPSLDRRRVSTAGSNTAGYPLSEPRTNYSSEAESHRGRKRRHFRHNKGEDSPERGKRKGWMTRGRSSSSSGLSSTDSDVSARRKKLDRTLTAQDENIGPLERHMKSLLEDDARAEEYGLSPILSSPEKHWGVGNTKQRPVPRRVTSETESEVDGHSNNAGARKATKRLSLLADKPADSRPSLDGLDSSVPNTPLTNTFSLEASSPPSRLASPERKSRRSKLPFFRSESAKGHRIDSTDFAADPANHMQPLSEPGRISFDQPTRSSSARPGVLRSHKTTDSLNSLASIQEQREPKRRKDAKDKEPSSAVTKFFKDVGREGSKARKFIFKKDKPPKEADETSSDESEQSSTTDDEGEMSKSVVKRRPMQLSRTTTETGFSDASDVSERWPKYGAELPTFKSAALQDHERDPSAAPSEGRRGRSRPARFDRLAPPRLDTDLSRSSSPGITQLHPMDRVARHRRHSEGPDTDSHSRSPSAIRRRMSKLLELPGGVGHGGLPPTELSQFSVERKLSGPPSARPSPQRHWSITDQTAHSRASSHRPSAASSKVVDSRVEITRIQALLLCSGIKAAELARRAHSVRDTPAPFLARAAASSSAAVQKHTRLVPTVARKEEHVLAARILASDLEASSAALVASMDSFRAQRVRSLHARCEAMRIELGDRLTPRCHAFADDADAFTREVTSGATLAVKAVADRVDEMGRARRRRMRWLRWFGWMVLEWCVLGVMWWVWLVVVVVRFGLGSVRGVVRGLKWFLWLE